MNNDNKNLRIMTWNVGLFSWMKYAHYLRMKIKGELIKNEYFQEADSEIVIKNILDINPDIFSLQEFYLKEDSDLLIHKLREHYPYHILINSWYHKHSILIMSKDTISSEKIGTSEFYIVNSSGLSFVPVHLNSFSAKKRLGQVDRLIDEYRKLGLKIDCILGDTNLWSFGHKQLFIYKDDVRAYSLISKFFNSITKDIGSTTKYFHLDFDKIFLSKNLKYRNLSCIKENGDYMDHYPLYVDISIEN